jgi:hypothetical protein
MKEKHQRETLRSRWEQIRKEVTEKEGRPQEETEEKELWEDKKEMEMLGSQMKTHMNRKCLRTKKIHALRIHLNICNTMGNDSPIFQISIKEKF